MTCVGIHCKSIRIKVFYLKEHFDGLGAGGPCSSTGDVLSDDSKGPIALPYAVVLRSMDRRDQCYCEK